MRVSAWLSFGKSERCTDIRDGAVQGRLGCLASRAEQSIHFRLVCGREVGRGVWFAGGLRAASEGGGCLAVDLRVLVLVSEM